jgi:transposase, IS30 family
MKGYKHLTFTDRLKIEAWQKVNVKPKKMAEQLGVHISTIYRELKRGVYTRLNSDLTQEQKYSPDIAEKKYRESLKAKGTQIKIGNDYEFATYLEYKVSVEKYSPEAVLGEIKKENLKFNTSISKTTFYRYIDNGIFLTLSNKDLPVKRNRKKNYNKIKKPARVPKGNSIEKRPKEIENRISFGHWEMDCVEGKKGTKKTLLVLTERKTRNEIIMLMKDKTAKSVVKSLNKIEKEYGTKMFKKVFLSITVDNGSEFADYKGIEQSIIGNTRTNVYYCHPYSSWERGSNENQNKMIRRHYPKGYDFTKTTSAEIKRLEKWINNYPRKIFGYYTSAELFTSCIDEINAA